MNERGERVNKFQSNNDKEKDAILRQARLPVGYRTARTCMLAPGAGPCRRRVVRALPVLREQRLAEAVGAC